MATTLDIAYFNSFYIKSSSGSQEWHVEESRIKGGFNEVGLDLGVKAYATNEEYAVEHRKNAMIYSGIINSRTGLNETNQFNMALPITKAVNSANGSIQKLHAEETNLLILQEDKVSKALIDKDAIFSAEGGGTVTSSNLVIGQIVPFAGKYGISKNPESFAVDGTRKYFSDKNRGVILRLSRDGLTPISDFGMRDFFRDKLRISQRIVGMYDTHHNLYYISLQGTKIMNPKSDSTGFFETISFSDPLNAWTSRHTFRPFWGFSHENHFYTFYLDNLYRQYSGNGFSSQYGDGEKTPPSITFSVNQNSASENYFYAIDYEGDPTWSVKDIKTNTEPSGDLFADKAKDIASFEQQTDSMDAYIDPAIFYKKGLQYCAALQNDLFVKKDELLINESLVEGLDVTGLKGNYLQMTFFIEEDSEKQPGYGNSRAELANVKTEFNPL
jgi:hypothetical protein|tara:strand:+ start:12661 stop:13986 length:1326 start_codon:yes stop_codon:yes gene_type:complete